jgi:hypothetical protein
MDLQQFRTAAETFCNTWLCKLSLEKYPPGTMKPCNATGPMYKPDYEKACETMQYALNKLLFEACPTVNLAELGGTFEGQTIIELVKTLRAALEKRFNVYDEKELYDNQEKNMGKLYKSLQWWLLHAPIVPEGAEGKGGKKIASIDDNSWPVVPTASLMRIIFSNQAKKKRDTNFTHWCQDTIKRTSWLIKKNGRRCAIDPNCRKYIEHKAEIEAISE